MDLGAHSNFITYALVKTLKNVELHEQKVSCVAFNGTEIDEMGYVEIPMYISNLLCTHQFFVIDIEEQHTQVVLGMTWQCKYQAYLY